MQTTWEDRNSVFPQHRRKVCFLTRVVKILPLSGAKVGQLSCNLKSWGFLSRGSSAVRQIQHRPWIYLRTFPMECGGYVETIG